MAEFTIKSAEELAKMTTDEQNKYMADKAAHEKQERGKEIEEATKGIKTDVDAIKQGMQELGESFSSLAEKVRTTESEVDGRKSVEDWVKENIESIKKAYKHKAGMVEVKAVADVTTANGTLPVALPTNYVAETQGVNRIPLKRTSLLDSVVTYNTNQKTLAYVEPVAGEGDFAQVLEGAEKPQLDIDWVTRYATPVKWAGYMKVTEEVMEDIPRMADMIYFYLRDKHDLKKERDVFTAISNAATTFSLTGALAGAVVDPNILDVVNALQLQIINSPNYTDEPDFRGTLVMINPSDFYKEFGTAKDGIGRPLFEAGYQANTGFFEYNGYRFFLTTLVTTGNILLIDPTKVEVSTYSPYRREIGWTDDDFIHNMFVILGESRGHIVIRNHDKRAFVKGAIATIKTNITKPEPTPPST